MNSYSSIAIFYNRLTKDVEYKKRADYFLSLFRHFDAKPTILLDAACGSGLMSVEMYKNGIDVIGVDRSENMLASARMTADSENADILFVNQDITKLNLYGSVDGAICTLDSINHLKKRQLEKFFKKVSFYLEENRVFIFDSNTQYKHKEILGNNYFEFEEENIFCKWQNKYTVRNGTVKMTLTFCEGKETYKEKITEYAYSIEEIKKLLEKCGFILESVFDDMSYNSPRENSERIIFIARKRKR